MFGASSALLALLAIVLVGQGVAALQEAGLMSVSSLDIPSAPVLGVHPTVESIAAQVALLVVIVVVFGWTRRSVTQTA
jgi:high-affinity iron transporter